jgi:SAM-dependent methyltransferase
MAMTEAQGYWEERYGAQDRVWSGRVNVLLAEIAQTLPPGRGLDLGCGEGADALWLAERGWDMVAVDISQTALARGAEDARARGLAVDFAHHDLSDSFPAGSFDLVSAQFLHSTVRLERERILRNGAAAVAPGGTLLIVDHGTAPPWSNNPDHHHHRFAPPEEVVAQLHLDDAEWEQVRVGPVEREGIGPDGQRGPMTDNVICLRRRPAG